MPRKQATRRSSPPAAPVAALWSVDPLILSLWPWGGAEQHPWEPIRGEFEGRQQKARSELVYTVIVPQIRDVWDATPRERRRAGLLTVHARFRVDEGEDPVDSMPAGALEGLGNHIRLVLAGGPAPDLFRYAHDNDYQFRVTFSPFPEPEQPAARDGGQTGHPDLAPTAETSYEHELTKSESEGQSELTAPTHGKQEEAPAGSSPTAPGQEPPRRRGRRPLARPPIRWADVARAAEDAAAQQAHAGERFGTLLAGLAGCRGASAEENKALCAAVNDLAHRLGLALAVQGDSVNILWLGRVFLARSTGTGKETRACGAGFPVLTARPAALTPDAGGPPWLQQARNQVGMPGQAKS